VEDQETVGASVVVMTLGIKFMFSLQASGFCSENCLQSVKPLPLFGQKQVEGGFFIDFFYLS